MHGGSTNTSLPNTRLRRPWLAAFAALNALSAWSGSIGLLAGTIDFGERNNDRLPFDSLVLAGLALTAVVALPLTALAWTAWVGDERTDEVALGAGLALVGWIAVQAAVLQAFSPFQPAYLIIGATFVGASHRLQLGPLGRGILSSLVGAVLAAIGIGLLPYLLKNGLSLLAVVAIVVMAIGLAGMIDGTRAMIRGRRLVTRTGGVAASLITLALAASVISPATAATNVPVTAVTTTPASLGLDHESVTLTTDDGVELAAWYLAGTNGAGVVVLHGAGSTRSSVVERAAVLHAGGYSVVLVDARGHGDSDGTAMGFGWYGDLDVGAATEFLASRPDVEGDRIGVVGFSMGGEEAIGAAARDARIRAVVAEGATARRAADKEWLSDVYGWRGWLQERLEYVQYGITDYLTEASPPTSLRSAVATAIDTRFLLIAGGDVADEGRAAAYLRSAATDRVTVWSVEDAGHTGGYDTRPDEWTRRVLEFLDDNLG